MKRYFSVTSAAITSLVGLLILAAVPVAAQYDDTVPKKPAVAEILLDVYSLEKNQGIARGCV